MPDIGGLEFLVIGVVALIVLGPKDLTKMFRTLGQFVGQVRGMAREFSRAMNDAADDAGVGELSRDLRNITNPKKMGVDALNKTFEGIDPTKYPEGSETRKLAEKKATAQAKTKEVIAAKQRELDARMAPAPEAAPEPAPETAAPETPRPSAGDT